MINWKSARVTYIQLKKDKTQYPVEQGSVDIDKRVIVDKAKNGIFVYPFEDITHFKIEE